MRAGRRGRWLGVALLALLGLGVAGRLGVAEALAEAREVPLIEAVKKADAQAVRALLQQRADVNTPEADGTTALHWAARQDDLEAADLLLRAGANPKAANVYGVTPLSLAAINGNAAMIERLIEAGADPNAVMGAGETALMTTARTGNVEAVKVLLARGADVNATFSTGQTALMFAAAEGHIPVIRALVAAGADVRARTNAEGGGPAGMNRGTLTTRTAPRPARDVVNSPPIRRSTTGGFTPFLFAVRAGHIDAVRTLLEAGSDINDTLPDGTGASVLAATNAHYELGLFLVDTGADPNAAANGWTALHALTWVRRPNFGFNPPGPVTTGSIDSLTFVREMAKRGADLNARMTEEPRNGYRNALNRIGATPLLMAARLADAPLMRVLVELGADPTLSNEDGTTVLMVAAGVGIHSPGEDPGTEEEALECVKLALELGGDVNAVDNNGETALHGGAYRGANSIVQVLVDNGANTLTVKNDVGWTPLRIAAGVFRTATYKEAPHTAALLRQLMQERGLPIALEDTASNAPGR